MHTHYNYIVQGSFLFLYWSTKNNGIPFIFFIYFFFTCFSVTKKKINWELGWKPKTQIASFDWSHAKWQVGKNGIQCPTCWALTMEFPQIYKKKWNKKEFSISLFLVLKFQFLKSFQFIHYDMYSIILCVYSLFILYMNKS